MTTLCAISGAVRDRSGNLLANQEFKFTFRSGVRGTADGVLLPEIETATTDGSGDISISLYTGYYRVETTVDERIWRFVIGVPNKATATFSNLLTQDVTITPGILEQTVQARDDAVTARNEAQAFAVSINPDQFPLKSNNLSDLLSASTALTNLGFTTYGKSLIALTSASANLDLLGFSTFTKSFIAQADQDAALDELGFNATYNAPDWQDLPRPGLYSGNNSANAPTNSGRYHGFHSRVSSTNQLNFVLNRDNGRAFYINRTGSWDSWRLIGASPTPLGRAVASSDSSIDFTDFDSTYYTSYLYILNNIVPGTNDVGFGIRVSSNGGTSYDSGTNYNWSITGFVTGGASGVAINASTYVRFTLGTHGGFGVNSTASAAGLSGYAWIHSPHTNLKTTIVGSVSYKDANGRLVISTFGGEHNLAAIVDGSRFVFSSGNIASGSIYMYGYCEDV